uniref:DUF4201 domain-containing protein n=1 Tax=Ascaris lumbricoides TaxID=6252 RepID=A0A0M3I021_ASCLU
MCEDGRSTESDSETEIEYSTYEKRREANVRKIVLLERLFASAKQRLYHERLHQLETRQVELLNQTAADYISKKTVLIDEHRARCEYNNAFRTLQMESLRRKMVGKLETSQKNLIHNKKMAFERIEAEIEDRIAELDEERRRCLSVIDEYDSEQKEHVKRRKTDDKAVEKLRNELDMPLVFYMLSREYLLMDIALVENALKAVNLRQTNMA